MCVFCFCYVQSSGVYRSLVWVGMRKALVGGLLQAIHHSCKEYQLAWLVYLYWDQVLHCSGAPLFEATVSRIPDWTSWTKHPLEKRANTIGLFFAAILSNNQVAKHIPKWISGTVTFIHMLMVIMHSVRQLLKLNHKCWPQRWCVCLAYSYTFYSPASCYHRLKYLKVFCYCMTPWLLLTVSMLYKYNGVGVAKWPYYTLGRWPHYTRNSGYKVIHIERWSQYTNGHLGRFCCTLMHIFS